MIKTFPRARMPLALTACPALTAFVAVAVLMAPSAVHAGPSSLVGQTVGASVTNNFGGSPLTPATAVVSDPGVEFVFNFGSTPLFNIDFGATSVTFLAVNGARGAQGLYMEYLFTGLNLMNGIVGTSVSGVLGDNDFTTVSLVDSQTLKVRVEGDGTHIGWSLGDRLRIDLLTVPEPSSQALVLLALAGLRCFGRRGTAATRA